MWKILVPFAILLAAVAAAVVIDKPQPPADIVFVNRGDVNTLDLQRMSWMQDLRVAAALYEGLVVNDVFSAGFDKKPGVAERWEVSADGRTYTFHLRESAKWSNGEPVTARDFVYSWRRALLPDLVGDYVGLFMLIDGAEAFFAWREKQLADFAAAHAGAPSAEGARAAYADALKRFDDTVGVRAVDDRTLVVTLTRRTPYFLDLCAFEVFAPVHAASVEPYQWPDPQTGRLNFRADWTKPPLLVSNGMFVLTSWRFKRDMRLERNPYYWNQAAINVDSIEIPSLGDANAAVLATQTGRVDWLSDVVPDYRADLLDQKRALYRQYQAQYDALKGQGLDPVAIDRRLAAHITADMKSRAATRADIARALRALAIHSFPAFGTYWYNFNCLPTLPDGRANPFHDPRVRKAFALCIDKQNVCDNVRRAGETVANTIIPRASMGGFASPNGLPCAPDPAAVALAKRLLAEAGYPDPSRMPEIEILFNTDGGHDKIAQAVKNDWEKYLGVTVRLAAKEIKIVSEDLKRQNYMVSRAGWFGDYGDPTTFLDLSRKEDGNNDRKYGVSPHPLDHYAQFESLMNQARDETDEQKRLDQLAEAERILMEDDLPMAPIFQYTLTMMFDPLTVSGPSPHPRQKQHIFLLDRLGDGKGSDVPLEIPPTAGKH